ncbi:MAG: glycosyltransferase [Imperialibacter sp.]|uniref:glycosyltransferase n=1 Tax=Imperialibacter sp. TaxID=2038411 RepID=UPI0032ED2C3C
MTRLANTNILVLSLPRHDERYTSTTWQISRELALDNNVILVDHPFTFTELFKGPGKPEIRKRILAYFNKPVIEKEGVKVLLPPFVWPVNSLPKGGLYNFFSGLNHQMLARRINRFLKKNDIESLVYVNSFDFYFPGLGRKLAIKPALSVYHCIDPMVKPFTLRHGPYLEQKAVEQSDMVISTAPALQKKFTDQGIENSFLVPNAANYKLFNKALAIKGAYHKSLAGIEGKVMGYLGNIERRTDFDLLHDVLEVLSDWHLVLAGPVEAAYVPEQVFDHPRIHFTGSCNHEEAPSVMARFDVAIIPFKCDEVSQGIYPLKLYEYLAAGKPVVSTNFNPEVLDSLGEVVEIGLTPEDFADKVLKAYASDDDEKQKQRALVASKNTWTHRAKQFGALIRSALEKQPKGNVAQRKDQKQPEA